MIRFFQHVMNPGLLIAGKAFALHVDVVGSPIYGRILFRSHDVEIRDCRFTAGLTLRAAHGVLIIGNWFESIGVTVA